VIDQIKPMLKFKQQKHKVLKFLRHGKTRIYRSKEEKKDFNNLAPQKKIAGNIELLSMHIPKTAGTSFFLILQQAYGKNGVMRMDYRPAFDRFIVRSKPYNSETLPDEIRVLHGHLNYKIISKYLDLNENVKIITWIRNPVERVISDYYYMLERLKDSFVVDPLHPNILGRMTKSLLEFAQVNYEQNKISKYLKGMNLNNFYFVGIVESFDEDMKELSKQLHWQEMKAIRQNITRKKPSSVSAEVYEAIKSMNHKDWEIYQLALAMRKKRGGNNG